MTDLKLYEIANCRNQTCKLTTLCEERSFVLFIWNHFNTIKNLKSKCTIETVQSEVLFYQEKCVSRLY